MSENIAASFWMRLKKIRHLQPKCNNFRNNPPPLNMVKISLFIPTPGILTLGTGSNTKNRVRQVSMLFLSSATVSDINNRNKLTNRLSY